MKALKEKTGQRKLITKAGGLVFCIVLCFSNGRAEGQSAIQRFDERILMSVEERRTPAQSGFFLFVSRTNNYVNLAVPVGLMAGGMVGDNKEMRQNALYVASSSAVSFLLTNLIKITVKRPRPFIKNVKIVPLYRAGGYSFPSGHTSSSFATATALSSAYPKWYIVVPSFLWASSVSYSRIYIGVHHPTDVAAGALVGAGSAFSMRFIRKD